VTAAQASSHVSGPFRTRKPTPAGWALVAILTVMAVSAVCYFRERETARDLNVSETGGRWDDVPPPGKWPPSWGPGNGRRCRYADQRSENDATETPAKPRSGVGATGSRDGRERPALLQAVRA